MGILDELKRRNVFRVSVAYLIVAWLVAQIADLVLGNIGAPDWVMPTLFLMLGLGFVAAVVISWAYELTPEGIKRERDVIRDDSITHVTAKKLDYITIAAVVGVLVVFGLQKADDRPAAVSTESHAENQETEPSTQTIEPGDHSIAVLPFANRSHLDEDLFFTDGIHDDLLTQLAKINDLKVISRTSVMQYRETEKGIPQIAEELGVSTILEGGVQRAGQRIRINAQLIDVATDEHLWAETFDREMTIENLFDIQTEITRQIVTAVRGQLTVVEQQAIAGAPTQSLEAYESYLKSKSLLTSSGYNLDKYKAAQPLAERAVVIDPNFALAHLLLADIHAQMVWLGFDVTEQRQQEARDAVRQAATILSPGSPDLLAAQGENLYRFEQDYAGALAAFQSARIAMPGDASILERLGYAQRRLGLWEESVSSFLQASEVDPANSAVMAGAVETLVMMHQWRRLEAQLLVARKRFPGNTDIASIAAMQPARSRGDVTNSRELLDKVQSDVGSAYFSAVSQLPWLEHDFAGVIKAWEDPEISQFQQLAGFAGLRELDLAMAYQHLGQQDRAAELLSQVIEQLSVIDRDRPNGVIAYELSTLAQALALRGEKIQAITVAEEAARLISKQKDSLDGADYKQILSWVLAISGESDRALKMLAEEVDEPGGSSRWDFYLDPRWDFFRDDERFNDLIRPDNLEQSSDE